MAWALSLSLPLQFSLSWMHGNDRHKVGATTWPNWKTLYGHTHVYIEGRSIINESGSRVFYLSQD